MALRLITAATALAVSLADVKVHLRLDAEAGPEDTLISAYIGAATEMAEQATGRAIMPQTWELTLDTFPDAVHLTRVPVASVTSVKYYDTTGVQRTLVNTAYTLDNADDFGLAYIVPAYSLAWPDVRGQINAVAVQYVAGYASAADVPESIKAWIKLAVGSMFENREAEVIASGSVLSLGFADRLLDRYKVYAL